MSDTPKTDELAKRDFVPDGLWIKHARELERENAALRADKERLDWIARNRSVSATERPLGVTLESLRVAIDAAMKEAQP